METKTIIIEVVVALLLSVLLGGVLLIALSIFGGNYATNFVFGGQRGYEATGMIGAMLGMPLGGILGAWLVRRFRSTSTQKISEAIGIGFGVGVALFVVLFLAG